MFGGDQCFESFFVNSLAIERDDPIFRIQSLLIGGRTGTDAPDIDEVPNLFQVRAEKTFLRWKSAWNRSAQSANSVAGLFQRKSRGIQGLVEGNHKIVASTDIARKELIETRARHQLASFLKIRRRVVTTFLKEFGVEISHHVIERLGVIGARANVEIEQQPQQLAFIVIRDLGVN